MTKDSTNCRVIIDLSWLLQASINSVTLENMYLGITYKLEYPIIDNMTGALLEVRTDPKGYKINLSRAFRQIPRDRHNYNFLCLKWQPECYSDQFCPFGHRFGSLSIGYLVLTSVLNMSVVHIKVSILVLILLKSPNY